MFQVMFSQPYLHKLNVDCDSSDSVSSRTLERRLDDLSQTLTVQSCVAGCQSQPDGFTVAGLEFGQECCTFINHLNTDGFADNSGG